MMNARSLVLVLWLLAVAAPVAVNSQGTDGGNQPSVWDWITALFRFDTCPPINRCGFFNLNYAMIRGESGTEECIEVCVWFPGLFEIAGYTCGFCDSDGIPTPTPPTEPTPTKPAGVPTYTFPPNFRPPTDPPIQEYCAEKDPRCLVGLAYAQYRGTQNTDSCEEICVFGARVWEGFTCGVCNTEGTSAPTGEPTDAPTTSSPTPPKGALTGSPTAPPTPREGSPTVGPVAAPTSTPTDSPAPTSTVAPTDSPVEGGGGGGFQISQELLMDASFLSAFVSAAARWETIVTGDLENINTNIGLDPPREGCTYPDEVDDVYICSVLEPIDGPVVGFARPIYLRDEPGQLPYTGEMIFDSEEMVKILAEDLLDDLILHEMGHVLGIGTIWNKLDLQDENDELCPYLGTRAPQEFKAISGCDSIPVEQAGIDATRCRHWSDSCMTDELMTGQLNFDANPLSRITIAMLEDMGYEVSYAAADEYTVANLDASDPTCVCGRRERERRNLWDSEHGQAVPLGERKTQRALELSDEVRYAIDFGLAILEESSQDGDLEGRKNCENKADIVSVIVKENGKYTGVLVQKPC